VSADDPDHARPAAMMPRMDVTMMRMMEGRHRKC